MQFEPFTEINCVSNYCKQFFFFFFGTGKSKIKLTKDAGFSSTSDSSGEHLLSPTHPAPSQNDVESESTCLNNFA